MEAFKVITQKHCFDIKKMQINFFDMTIVKFFQTILNLGPKSGQGF